jgi:hypothetical protein
MTKMTRAERSAHNKAMQAARIAEREADAKRKLEDRLARERQEFELAERARAQAQADAQRLMALHGDMANITSAHQLRQFAKALTPQLMQMLIQIASDPMTNATGRVSAINALLDRGWGKAVQPVSDGANPFDHLDEDELDQYLIGQTKQFIDGKVIEHVRTDGKPVMPAADTRGTDAQDQPPARAASRRKGSVAGRTQGTRSEAAGG